MKHIFTISILVWSVCLIQAQVVPNGGFEEWDYTDTLIAYPYPLGWIWSNTVSPNCPVFDPSETMEPSTMNSSGCCSVKITTHPCKIGFIHSGDLTLLAPRHWAFDCTARPAYLNFQYMFQPEGGDSAFVRILLFNFDSITPGLSFYERIDPVASASGYIAEGAGSFTPFSLPIQYLTEETPSFMHIFFSVSREFGFAPYSLTSVGTSLWLDDVHLSGTTGIQEYAPNDILTVFPNPAGDRIWFKELATNGAVHVRVFDAKGAQMMDQRITDPAQGLDVKGLRPGVYSIMMLADAGGILRANWVKE